MTQIFNDREKKRWHQIGYEEKKILMTVQIYKENQVGWVMKS